MRFCSIYNQWMLCIWPILNDQDSNENGTLSFIFHRNCGRFACDTFEIKTSKISMFAAVNFHYFELRDTRHNRKWNKTLSTILISILVQWIRVRILLKENTTAFELCLCALFVKQLLCKQGKCHLFKIGGKVNGSKGKSGLHRRILYN